MGEGSYRRRLIDGKARRPDRLLHMPDTEIR
jgi:hypothetical protein